MPYELYWRGPLSTFLIYVEKARLESQKENRVAWLHGAYITRAITSAFSTEEHPHPYPQGPIVQLTPKQEEKRQAMEDAIAEHNEKMREIREQSAAKLQQKLRVQMSEVKSHVGADH